MVRCVNGSSHGLKIGLWWWERILHSPPLACYTCKIWGWWTLDTICQLCFCVGKWLINVILPDKPVRTVEHLYTWAHSLRQRRRIQNFSWQLSLKSEILIISENIEKRSASHRHPYQLGGTSVMEQSTTVEFSVELIWFSDIKVKFPQRFPSKDANVPYSGDVSVHHHGRQLCRM